ncbi:MAG: exodeoxyribonuclease VII small subunit [Deltaproteobacteria bacterium]|nr:exodeoxyribonuclease VII small subunit [Deltaproteobacteria bacterium]
MAKDKFEDAMDKLEDIVKKMEAGNMSLDESLKAFEEGIKLVRVCTKKLDEAQRRVDVLLAEGSDMATAPFSESDHDD